MPAFLLSPVLLWFIAGIFFLGFELFLPGLILFFFGIGAWCAALSVWIWPLTLSTQILIFLGASLVSLFLLRGMMKKVFQGRISGEATPDPVLSAGMTGVVAEDILPPAEGKIKYRGSFWRAVADRPIPKGTVVRIIKKEHLILTVSPMEQGESR